MPTNVTDNIYSTEYEDSGTPIPSTKIGYDNTESGLEATTVQSAIDEIVETINEKGYHIVGVQTASVTATKMSDYYTALVTAITSIKSALEDDEAIILKCIDRLVTNGSVNFVDSEALWITKNTDITNVSFVLNAIYLQAQGAEMKLVSYIFGSNYNHQTEVIIGGTGTTITQKDSSEDAINSTLRYIKVKK